MATISVKKRLKPFLLDRLTDEAAGMRLHSAEFVARMPEQFLTTQQYRDSVLRDLQNLFNAHALPLAEDIERYPRVARSVVNYGMPDIASMYIEGISRAELQRMIVRVIERFEPRILPHTLKVTVQDGGGADLPTGIQVEIEAEIWAVPMPELIFLKTEIDLGTGRVDVKAS